MARFTHVEVYPPTGYPDRLQDGRGSNPIKDAFIRSSRCVTWLYDEALTDLGIAGYKSMLRLFCGHDPRRTPDRVEVVVFPQKPYDAPGEMGAIRIPLAIGRLDARQRAVVALEAVHTVVLALGGFRGWDIEQFRRCYDHVVANDFGYRWASPWKASPGRRHETRVVFRLPPDDGWGRVRLEVKTRGVDGPVAVSDEAIAYSTAAGFQRSAKTLRWVDGTDVAATPYCGLGSPDYSGPFGRSPPVRIGASQFTTTCRCVSRSGRRLGRTAIRCNSLPSSRSRSRRSWEQPAIEVDP